MTRALLVLATAGLLAGAGRPPSVDYRLGVAEAPGGPPSLDVELRLRGDADGETHLIVPPGAGPLTVQGARAEAGGVLRHRPGARLDVRYQVRSPDPGRAAFLALGDTVLAWPEGREAEPATFRWARLPPGWRAASSLEPARPLSVAEVRRSVAFGGSTVSLSERPLPGGVLRLALPADAPSEPLATQAAQAAAAVRGLLGGAPGPYLLALAPTTAPAFAAPQGLFLPAAPPPSAWSLAHQMLQGWIPAALGRSASPPAPWLQAGLTGLLTEQALLRAGLEAPGEAAAGLGAQLKAYDLAKAQASPEQRGLALALKWDEDIRRKSGGRADLAAVVRRMREHAAAFPPGQAPDVVTGLVSAAWVTAGLDLRLDIARYAVRGEAVPLPAALFDGCVEVRDDLRPAWDPGLDVAASQAARQLKGVRRDGPAWASGLRNGMRLEALAVQAGDTSRQVQAQVRDARGRSRAVRYWPYGDEVIASRTLQLKPGLTAAAAAACARRLGGVA